MRKLGKGLSELGLNELLSSSHASSNHQRLQNLSIDSIFPGQFQPRKSIDSESLTELTDSIRVQGILQPIIVRPHADHRYEIIAGERRWRAASLAGLITVPAIVRETTDQAAAAFALIENIQRRDLNAIEEAQALQRLLQEFKLTHDEVAKAVGKSRVAVTNLLRLLQLDEEVKIFLIEGKIQKGHALVILTLESQRQKVVARQIVDKGLSVRQTEELVQGVQKEAPTKQNPFKVLPRINPEISQLQNKLAEKLSAKVSIRQNATGKGKIVINYRNLDELSGILSRINE